MAMLTPAWTQLKYHPAQCALWRCNKRFAAVLAGRQSGKSELLMRYVVRWLPIDRSTPEKPRPNPNYFYILPTREQAKRVAWKRLKALTPKHWLHNISESELKIETVFGSTLWLIGGDRPERIDGMQFDGGVIDESSDQRPELFNVNVLPTLSHFNGWVRRAGIPKRHGRGAIDFKEFCDRAESGIDPECDFFHWHSADIVPPHILTHARKVLDDKDYNEQFAATWETSSGNIFYTFDDKLNVSDVVYKPERKIVVSSDFNVSPMSWVIGHRWSDRLEIFDEISLNNASTQLTLDELWRRYGAHKSGFEFFGDATSKARKTAASSAAQSDYLIIRADNRFNNPVEASIYYNNSNPAIVNRFAACNALFKNAEGVRRCFIHPRCKNLIADLKRRSWKKDSREPDDSGEIGHMSDALGYVIHRAFPIKATETENVPQVGIM